MQRLLRTRTLFHRSFFQGLLAILSMLSMVGAAKADDFSLTYGHSITYVSSSNKYIRIRKLHTGHMSLGVSLTGSSKFSTTTTGVTFSDTTSDTVRYFYVSFATTTNDTSTARLIIYDSAQRDTVTLTGYDTNYTYAATYDYSVSHTWPIASLYTNSTGYTYSKVYNAQHHPITVTATLTADTSWRFDSTGAQSLTLHLDSLGDHTSGRQLVAYFRRNGRYLDTAKLILSCSSPYSQHDTIYLIARDSMYAPAATYDFSISHSWSVFAPGSIHIAYGYRMLYNAQTHPISVSAHIIGDSSWGFDTSGLHSKTYSLDSTNDHTSGRQLVVYFRANGKFRDTATLILNCTSPYTQADTIHLVSVDSNYYVAPTYDYEVTPSWPHVTLTGSFGYTGARFYNRQTHPETISCTIVGDTGWRFDSTGTQSHTLSLDSLGDRTGGRTLYIQYRSTGKVRDTAKLYLSCTSPYTQRDTITLIAYDSTVNQTSYHLTGNGFSLSNLSAGDSVCGNFVIRNTNAVSLHVTSVAFNHTSDGGWSWDSGSTTNYTLPAHDSISYTACWHPSGCGATSNASLTFSYVDSSSHTGTLTENCYGSSQHCISSNLDSIRLTAITGGWAEGEIRYTNHDGTHDTVYASHYNLPDSNNAWTVRSNDFPRYVHKDSSVTVKFRFTPPHTGTWVAYLVPFTQTNDRHYTSMRGTGIGSSDTSLNLYASTEQLIALRSSTTAITKSYRLHNNSTHTVYMTSVTLNTGAHFSVTAVHPHATTDTLPSDSSVVIDLHFDADTLGYYQDSLVVEVRDGLLPVMIPIQAVAEGVVSGVDRHDLQSSGASMWLSPNPAYGPVTIGIEGADKARIEIFDMLGNRVGYVTDTQEFVWSSANPPAGTYIVRASGTDINGHPFVISKQLSLQK